MEWGFLDYQIIRYAIDGSLVHQDLTPPDNKRHVHFDDDDDEDDDDSDANDDDSADTSASAPRASPPPSDNAGAGAGSSVSSAAPSGRTGRSASLPVQSSSAPAPAGRSCRSASPQGRTSPSPPPGPTPSILFTPEDIYKWTVNNGKKGPKKESNAGPMTKKAGVTKPLKGILKK